MAERTVSVIRLFLLVEDPPEYSSVLTDVHSLTCVWPIASFPKAF